MAIQNEYRPQQPPPGISANIECEKHLLGTMMINPKLNREIHKVIHCDRSDVFWDPAHRTVFQTLMRMTLDGEEIDLINLRDDLSKRCLLEEIGGEDYLVEMAESAVDRPAALKAAVIIYRAAARRDKLFVAAITETYAPDLVQE